MKATKPENEFKKWSKRDKVAFLKLLKKYEMADKIWFYIPNVEN